jgi:hypothetical protein
MRRRHTLLFVLLLVLCTSSWIVLSDRHQGADPPRSPIPREPDIGDARRYAAEPGAVHGLVRDPRGPVAAVRVRFQGLAPATLTDAQGRFCLPAPKNPTRLVAWKEGYFITGASADRVVVSGTLAALLPLVRVPLCLPADRLPLLLTLAHLPTEDCIDYGWVDPAPNAAQGHNCGNCHGEIYREWDASGHARSASNRRFLNVYDGTDWRGRRNVGWNLLAEHPDGAGVCTACHAPTVPFGDPGYFDLRRAHGVAARGVHCDYCHKIVDAPTKGVGLTHGRFNLDLLRPAEGQLFFGPLDDVDRGDDAFAPLYRESRYCASCHEGTVFGVHGYGTYSEWLQSPARKEGKQCQTCHMAPTGLLSNIAPGKGGIPRDPKTLASHRLFTGSQADMLRRCLKVAVVATCGSEAVRVEVEVRAEQVGHRVPTGFVDRNLLLIVEAIGMDGKPVSARTGPKLPPAAGKASSGLPGRLYAKLLKDWDGRSPVPFWRADPEAVDTRLVPGRTDASVYTFLPSAERVRLRLVYRRFWQEVAETKGWPDSDITVVDQSLKMTAGEVTRWSNP